MSFYEYDPVEEEIAEQDRRQRAYRRALAAHPDCIDPDHPGCESCRDEGEDLDE